MTVGFLTVLADASQDFPVPVFSLLYGGNA